MPQVSLPGVHTYRDRHGKITRCQLRFGRRTCMVDIKAAPIGSTEWLAQYYAFRAGEALPKTRRVLGSAEGSVNAVIDAYMATLEYKKMELGTQRDYRAPFELLRREHGTELIVGMRRRHIVSLLNETENNGQYNALLNAVRKIITQSIIMELREDDPTLKLKKKTSDNEFGRRSWTLEYIQQYRARHPIGTTARLALEIGFNTGLRISDLILFGRQHLVDDGRSFFIIPYKTRKHGNKVRQSIRDQHLIAALAAAPVRGQRAYLCKPSGGDYNVDDLGHDIAQWCKEASVPDYCRSHGWRKAFAVAASHAGCSNQQIMALLGDRDPKMVELYTEERDTWLLSEGAADKIEAMRAKAG